MERVRMDARAQEGEKVRKYQREEELLEEGRKRGRANEEDLKKRES